MSIRSRIVEYLALKGISKYKFYKDTGISNGFLDKSGAIGSDKCELICSCFPDMNPEWLLIGEGCMLKDLATGNGSPEQNEVIIKQDNSVNLLIDKIIELTKENTILKEENQELKIQEYKTRSIAYKELEASETDIAAEP